MKNRNVLFGYCYKNGIITVHQKNAEVVKSIYDYYINGDSLLKISERLNKMQIEYMPGVTAWNKARIMRILEDVRYIGNDRYPSVIDKDIQYKVQTLKYAKNNQKGTNRKDDIFRIAVSIRCPTCYGELRRFTDRRLSTVRWRCKTTGCDFSIGKSDSDFLNDITDLLNCVIDNPDMIYIPTEKKGEESTELIRLGNEIERMTEHIPIDSEAVKKKMIERASLKYSELNSAVCQAQILKDIFKNSKALTVFSQELFMKTTDEIRILSDGEISIVLENGQEIKKDRKA